VGLNLIQLLTWIKLLEYYGLMRNRQLGQAWNALRRRGPKISWSKQIWSNHGNKSIISIINFIQYLNKRSNLWSLKYHDFKIISLDCGINVYTTSNHNWVTHVLWPYVKSTVRCAWNALRRKGPRIPRSKLIWFIYENEDILNIILSVRYLYEYSNFSIELMTLKKFHLIFLTFQFILGVI